MILNYLFLIDIWLYLTYIFLSNFFYSFLFGCIYLIYPKCINYMDENINYDFKNNVIIIYFVVLKDKYKEILFFTIKHSYNLIYDVLNYIECQIRKNDNINIKCNEIDNYINHKIELFNNIKTFISVIDFKELYDNMNQDIEIDDDIFNKN